MTDERAVEPRTDRLDLWPRRFFDWLGWPSLDLQHDLKVEEFADGDDYVIRVEMPGLDPDKDVQVHVRSHMLEVRAERKVESTSQDADRYRSEFRYGSFLRRVPLPPDADESSVHATYKDGILEVRLPLEVKHAEATKIPVTRS